MSETGLLLAEIQALKRRIQSLETVTEHPGFAASEIVRLGEDNVFTGALNTFDNDVDIDGDLTVGGDATITGVVQAAAAWIPGVAVSLNAKLYCGYNGNEPYETTYTGSSTAHRGQTGTESGGLIYRPGKFGKAAQVAEATTNMVLNPVAGAAGNIAALGAATVTLSSTTKYWIHSTSLKLVTTAAANDGVDYTLSALSNAVHYVTIRTDIAWTTQEWSLNGGTNWRTPTLLSSDDAGWYVYGYSFLAADANGSTSLDMRQTDATVRTVYIGHVQAEAKAYPTPPCHGALGTGHSWSSTAHASTSSRTAARITYNSSGVRTDVGTIMAWVFRYGNRGAESVVFQMVGTTAGNIILRIRSGTDVAQAFWGTSALAGANVPLGEWHHLAMSYNGTTLRLYQNGILTVSGAISGFVGVPTTYNVGATSFTNHNANALLDDFVILSRAADADEIRAIYESQCQLICS